MKSVKIGTIILSEDAVKDHVGKTVLVEPLPHIAFKVLPNNYSFHINFSLLYLKKSTTYKIHIQMVQSDGSKIIDSKLTGVSLIESNDSKMDFATSFVNAGVKNQEFTKFGDCKVTISIEDENNPENKDSMTITVPILRRE